MRKLVFFSLLMVVLLSLIGCNQPVSKNESASVVEATELTREAVPAPQAEEWVSTRIYNTGDRVRWNGFIYRAQWWTTGEQPDKTGPWGVWVKEQPVGPILKLTFDISKTVVQNGETVTLSWKTENAVKVVASGGWSGTKAASGSEVTPALTAYTEYTITATDVHGKTLTKTVSVMVETIKPVIMFSADSYAVKAGGKVTLSWDVTDATSLTASGDWAGSKPMKGNELTAPINAVKSFTLTATNSKGVSVSKTVSVALEDDLPEMQLYESRLLTDAQIIARYRGIDPAYLSEQVAGSIQELMSKTQYNALFPYRIGGPGWREYFNKVHDDYYNYDNFVLAFQEIADVMIRIETRRYANRIFRLNKKTKIETYIMEHPEYNVSWLQGLTPDVDVVDYGKFVSEGTLETRKREFAAFLANISHETTGGWPTAPGGQYSWGLCFAEEVYHDDNCSCGTYTKTDSVAYPPKPGECYHGRGPMQLSWNMNYGLLSQVLYNDKNILLNNPDVVAHEGKLGIVAAIWFWMTPQLPKPACHNVMVGTWEPTPADIAANRLPGFGVTINVINGAQEAGKPGNPRVQSRLGFYEKISTDFGVSMGPNLDPGNQKSF